MDCSAIYFFIFLYWTSFLSFCLSFCLSVLLLLRCALPVVLVSAAEHPEAWMRRSRTRSSLATPVFIDSGVFWICFPLVFVAEEEGEFLRFFPQKKNQKPKRTDDDDVVLALAMLLFAVIVERARGEERNRKV